MLPALIILAIIAALVAYIVQAHAITINIYRKKDYDMSAITDLNDAVARVGALVASLRTDLANADQTPAIQSATDALNAIAPVPVSDAGVTVG